MSLRIDVQCMQNPQGKEGRTDGNLRKVRSTKYLTLVLQFVIVYGGVQEFILRANGIWFPRCSATKLSVLDH